MKAINRIRQGYHCNSLSEICTVDGTEIDENILNIECNAIRNNHEWATKTRITITDHKIWRIFLKMLCEDNNWTLTEPLGAWLQ